ncbi:hypothetical protein PR048_028107 [Dryococelus australis]|uniref:Uncharacterized protein n=1 Tax=Dryococelus australis TaxID=614101 RepID=A0ABQ9GID6_9NEOP|nr:hypothetical protein PR048_028107 [Dryococelus australis]
MRVIYVNMERRRNDGAGGGGGTADPREGPPTNGIVRHHSHLRKSGDPPTNSGQLILAGCLMPEAVRWKYGLAANCWPTLSGMRQLEACDGWMSLRCRACSAPHALQLALQLAQHAPHTLAPQLAPGAPAPHAPHRLQLPLQLAPHALQLALQLAQHAPQTLAPQLALRAPAPHAPHRLQLPLQLAPHALQLALQSLAPHIPECQFVGERGGGKQIVTTTFIFYDRVLCYNMKMGLMVEDLPSATPSESPTARDPEESLRVLQNQCITRRAKEVFVVHRESSGNTFASISNAKRHEDSNSPFTTVCKTCPCDDCRAVHANKRGLNAHSRNFNAITAEDSPSVTPVATSTARNAGDSLLTSRHHERSRCSNSLNRHSMKCKGNVCRPSTTLYVALDYANQIQAALTSTVEQQTISLRTDRNETSNLGLQPTLTIRITSSGTDPPCPALCGQLTTSASGSHRCHCQDDYTGGDQQARERNLQVPWQQATVTLTLNLYFVYKTIMGTIEKIHLPHLQQQEPCQQATMTLTFDDENRTSARGLGISANADQTELGSGRGTSGPGGVEGREGMNQGRLLTSMPEGTQNCEGAHAGVAGFGGSPVFKKKLFLQDCTGHYDAERRHHDFGSRREPFGRVSPFNILLHLVRRCTASQARYYNYGYVDDGLVFPNLGADPGRATRRGEFSPGNGRRRDVSVEYWLAPRPHPIIMLQSVLLLAGIFAAAESALTLGWDHAFPSSGSGWSVSRLAGKPSPAHAFMFGRAGRMLFGTLGQRMEDFSHSNTCGT